MKKGNSRNQKSESLGTNHVSNAQFPKLSKSKILEYMAKLLFVITLVFSFSSSHLQPSLMTQRNKGKIQKVVKKVWKGQEVQIQKMTSQRLSPNALSQNVFSIKSEETQLGYMILRRVHGCKIGGCDANSSNDHMVQYVADFDEGSYETFDYLMIVNNDFSILKLSVYDYPGEHGYEVTSKRWLRQFEGYKGDQRLQYNKDIDAISGATISGNSITADVQRTHRLLSESLSQLSSN